MSWAAIIKWLGREWWGLAVAYALLFGTLYAAIWVGAEPLGIPDTLSELPALFYKRGFYYVLLVALVTPHVLIALEMWRRRDWSHPFPPSVVGSEERPGADAETVGPRSHDGELSASLAKCQETLRAYESLEQEILGLFAPGHEFALSELQGLLSMHSQPDANRRIRLAVASLEATGKIYGTGGIIPKLKRAPRTGDA